MNVPEKHRAVAHAWVDGAEVQAKAEQGQLWLTITTPEFHAHQEYRIKPKPKVKKWRWVVRDGIGGELLITSDHYTASDAGRFYCVQKIDCTEIEVDE